MAVDGFVVDLFDSAANARVFGRPKGGRTPGTFPQARVLALCEVGTHVLWKCLLKPIRCAEIVRAQTLLRQMDATMLLLWDRGFLSYADVSTVGDRQAHLLARIKKNLVFTKREVLADGSFLAKLYPSQHARKKDPNAPLMAYQERLDYETRLYEATAQGFCEPDNVIGAKLVGAPGEILPTMDEQEQEL